MANDGWRSLAAVAAARSLVVASNVDMAGLLPGGAVDVRQEGNNGLGGTSEARVAAPPLELSTAAANAVSGGLEANSIHWGRARTKLSAFVGVKTAGPGQLKAHPSLLLAKRNHCNAPPMQLVRAIEGDADSYATYKDIESSVQRTVSDLTRPEELRRLCLWKYLAAMFGRVSRWTGYWMTGTFLAMAIVLGISLDSDPLVRFSTHGGYTESAGSDGGTHPMDVFEINDAVSAFLGITAVVYALIFASAFTEAQARFDEIRRSLIQEANGVHTAMLLVRTLDAENVVHKMRTLLLFGHYIQTLSEDITLDGGTFDVNNGRSNIETLYAAMPSLERIASDGDTSAAGEKTDALDRAVISRIIDMVNQVSQARSVRETAVHNEHHWITYAFLFEMGLITTFGVLLLQFGNAELNILLPTLIILAIFSSMVFLADLEHPFDGLVTVDVSIFDRIRRSISDVLTEVSVDSTTTVWVGQIPLDMLGERDNDDQVGKTALSLLFSKFGRVESITIRRKDVPPSWDVKKRLIGSWALITFVSTHDVSAGAAVEAALSWSETDGHVAYGPQGAKTARLDVNRVDHTKLGSQHTRAAPIIFAGAALARKISLDTKDQAHSHAHPRRPTGVLSASERRLTGGGLNTLARVESAVQHNIGTPRDSADASES